MDAVYKFAELFEKLRYEDLPSPAVEAAKKSILDSLATALGGSGQAGIGELVDLVREWSGNPQSTVIAHNLKCPTPHAAQVNAAMVHALDYDDGHPVAQVHIGCVAVPTGFAVAERVGGISGRELIAAIALGSDFLARLGLASFPHGSLIKSGWHPTALFGYLGAAAIAGRIIGLDRDKMVNGLGIALHQCAGSSQCVQDGALTKRMGPGLAARGGITAALMAERGITGARNVLEGEYGLFNQYMSGDFDIDILTGDLGTKFEGTNIGQKPYPCCGFTHPFIDAVLTLKSKYHFPVNQIKNITARGGQSAYEISQPREVKCHPRNSVDAQFSVPWAIAVAIVRGAVAQSDFTADAIRNEELLAVANLVTGKLDPSMNRHGVGPGRVEITLKDGTLLVEEVEHFLGSVENPMTFTDCARKFRESTAVSRKPLSRDDTERVIESIALLEEMEDATAIIRRLG